MPLDNPRELFYLVDKNDKVLGSITRQQAHQNKNKIHRSIFIILFNNKNQILLQKRSQHKDTYPNYWTISVSGHVTYRQTYKQAAKREFKEELGFKSPKLKLIAKKIIKMPNETEYSAIYITKISNESINFDKTEINQVKWVSIKDLQNFIKCNNFTPAARKILTTYF